MSNIKYVLTMQSLVAFIDGKSIEISKKSLLFPQALVCLEANDAEGLKSLGSVADFLLSESKEFAILNGQLYYNKADASLSVGDVITKKIIASLQNGVFDVAPFLKFIENILLNPKKDIVLELYEFLETNDLALTEDGCFLAYKNVCGDYLDIYTRTMDNSIGMVVKQARNTCNSDRNMTCSNGLHFCSKSYLSHYSATANYRTIIVKVNPKDVVAIPTDYNFAKGRACEYEVVGEIEIESHAGVDAYTEDNGVISVAKKQNDLEEKVNNLVKELFGLADTKIILASDTVDSLGGDELDLVELVMAVEDEFEIEIPDEAVDINSDSPINLEAFTIQKLYDLVYQQLNGATQAVEEVVDKVASDFTEQVEWVTHGDKGATSTKVGFKICDLPKFESAQAKIAQMGVGNYSYKIEKDSSSIDRVLVLVIQADGVKIQPIVYAPRASALK